MAQMPVHRGLMNESVYTALLSTSSVGFALDTLPFRSARLVVMSMQGCWLVDGLSLTLDLLREWNDDVNCSTGALAGISKMASG